MRFPSSAVINTALKLKRYLRKCRKVQTAFASLDEQKN